MDKGKSSDNKERNGRLGEGTRLCTLREDAFEELDTTIDPMIRFPELRIKNQYAQEVAPFGGTHD